MFHKISKYLKYFRLLNLNLQLQDSTKDFFPRNLKQAFFTIAARKTGSTNEEHKSKNAIIFSFISFQEIKIISREFYLDTR